MTMARNATWANMGTEVNDCNTLNEVMQKAGLDYQVEKRKIQFNMNGFHTLKDKMVTVEKGNPDHVFGVVGKDYEICQNVDAFDFVDCIDGQMKFLKAGETKSGKIYIIGELPEVEVLGDMVRPHLIFQNSHNGTSKVMANLCMLRIVCQNQFAAAFKNAANAIRIKHSTQMVDRLEQARMTIQKSYEYIQDYKDLAGKFAVKHISDNIIQGIIKEMLKIESEADMNKTQTLKFNAFNEAYRADDNANFVGTAWGVINAYTDFATHLPAGRNTKTYEEKLFLNNTFDNAELGRLINRLEAI